MRRICFSLAILAGCSSVKLELPDATAADSPDAGGPDAALPDGVVAVTLDGDGGGRVVSSPDGLDCGDLCEASFPPNTTVNLTATADDDASFAGWGGDCSGAASTCTIAVGAAASVTA